MSEDMKDIMNSADEALLYVYNRFPVVFDHGKGVRLYDSDGREYLDFASGIGVMAIGYSDKEYRDAIHSQVDKLLHTSNLYYTKPLRDAAIAATKISGMDKVFFTNSGAEAIEGAIKTAKKYARLCDEKNGIARKEGYEIIAMRHSFHGRTVGAVSVTGNDHYREPFYPLMSGVRFAEYNNLESVKSAVSDNTCAVIMETVQGEGGIYPADEDFIKGVRKLCDDNGMLLILDEIQCGMARCGEDFAYMHYGVKPDILTAAKALGGGVPVGAFFVTDTVAKDSLVPGDHGTTYGGNPLVCTAVATMCGIMKERDIAGHVKSLTPYLEDKLDALVVKSQGKIVSRRGMGFMQGLVLADEINVSDIVKKSLDAGLIVLSAEGNVLRLLPPLVIGESDIDEAVSLLDEILG